MPSPHPSPGSPPLAAVCGLYCGACSVYLATREDPARLERLAAKLGQGVEETRCQGCRSPQVSRHCRDCRLKACAEGRGHAFCGACDAYPCPDFAAFQAAWLQEMPKRHACARCGTVNAAYDRSCRSCGHRPASPFIQELDQAIRRHLDRQASLELP